MKNYIQYDPNPEFSPPKLNPELAAKMLMKALGNNLHNCQTLLRVDNITAICYINRMGKCKK